MFTISHPGKHITLRGSICVSPLLSLGLVSYYCFDTVLTRPDLFSSSSSAAILLILHQPVFGTTESCQFVSRPPCLISSRLLKHRVHTHVFPTGFIFNPFRLWSMDDLHQTVTSKDLPRRASGEVASVHQPDDKARSVTLPLLSGGRTASNSPTGPATTLGPLDYPAEQSTSVHSRQAPSSTAYYSLAGHEMSRPASSGPTSIPGSRSQPYQLVSPGTPADPRAMSQVSPGFIFVMFPMFACFVSPCLLLSLVHSFRYDAPLPSLLLSLFILI